MADAAAGTGAAPAIPEAAANADGDNGAGARAGNGDGGNGFGSGGASAQDELDDELGDDLEDEAHPWDDIECKKLYRVYCNTRAMLTNRGYGGAETGVATTGDDVKFLDDDEDPMDNIRAFYERTKGTAREVERSKMRIEASRGEGTEEGAEKIVVFFEDKVTGMERVSQLEEDAVKIPNISRMVLVSRERTAALQRVIDHINNDPDRAVYVEHFRERELLLDLTTHTLVPNHKVLSNKEKAELLARYKINTYQLPKIRHVDPIARHFGLLPGDVVKISRPSETAGRYVTYRVCVINSID